jgi:uncharacterized phage protein (TIGR01671 family)
MSDILYRSVHVDFKGKFVNFRYWGIDYPEKGVNCFPAMINNTVIKCHDQWTGLNDKHGVKIFEGDIVKFQLYDFMEVPEDNDSMDAIFNDHAQITVVKPNGIIEGDFDDFNEWLLKWAMDSEYVFEVIGNIHDQQINGDSEI